MRVLAGARRLIETSSQQSHRNALGVEESLGRCRCHAQVERVFRALKAHRECGSEHPTPPRCCRRHSPSQ
eukprot:scaffold10150_cov28-Tisochrysis_lutea.AAC.1